MDYATTKTRKTFEVKDDRDRVIAYLKYAVDDVAELSPASASLLVAAIDGLRHGEIARGNDIKKPS
jgi:hypothetical protein